MKYHYVQVYHYRQYRYIQISLYIECITYHFHSCYCCKDVRSIVIYLFRSELPDLFGSEDQDLRLAPFSDMNSKDWSQYKANHPDEYSPSPARQESFEGRNVSFLLLSFLC